MGNAVSPSIDHLELCWHSIDVLCRDVTEDEWKTPTGCPGWTVQDQISHLIDYEASALGRPRPEHTVGELPHLKNPLGTSNEVGIDARRALAGAEVLAELREVVAARHAQLLELTTEDLAREMTTPAGPGTLADMLTLRVMDTWSHEQDIRRALGRPGHETGPVAEEAVAYFAKFLPFVVGKRAGAPDGTTVVVDITGVQRVAIAVADGRGALVADEPTSPTVVLTMPPTTFAALAGGRTDRPDDIQVTGDQQLAESIIAAAGIMP